MEMNDLYSEWEPGSGGEEEEREDRVWKRLESSVKNTWLLEPGSRRPEADATHVKSVMRSLALSWGIHECKMTPG